MNDAFITAVVGLLLTALVLQMLKVFFGPKKQKKSDTE